MSIILDGLCTWHGIKGYAIYLFENKYHITRYGEVVETCDTVEQVSKRYVALAWSSEASHE